MKLLITGGAGFIGSNLCEFLLREGHSLTILDELNDFYSPSLKRENLASIQKVGAFDFHEVDICDYPRVSEIFESVRPEAVIHLAARAGIRPSLEQPLLYTRVNVYGTTCLLEASRHSGVKKFVFASSSSIYGIANRVPFSEDDQSNLPISPYAATKIAGEKIAYTYFHLYSMPVVCLRFFTVYGPRQRPDLAIRKFTGMISRGQPITVFGDGSSGRDYTFVDDTVQGIYAALQSDCGYEIFNLGNSHPITLNHMVQAIEEAVGKKAIIRHQPDQPGDVPITFADISKARRILNYSPSTPFAQGIGKFVEWYRTSQA
jgi:UDP-glucuronate 4-epimerase